MLVTWKAQLEKKLIQEHGAKKGKALSKKFSNAFPLGYIDDYSVNVAISDIDYMERLSTTKPLDICFYLSPEKEGLLHLRIFQWQNAIPLSDILPMLENLDLRVYNERPHRVNLANSQIWISDFSVSYPKMGIEIDKIQDIFREAFINIYLGICENDGFNKLVLGALLSWHEIIIFRAYTKYLLQVGFRFSQAYIEKTLVANPTITQQLIQLFKVLNDPHKKTKSNSKAVEIEQQIQLALESVSSLDEDHIFRRLLVLIKATLRTNYFLLMPNGNRKDYVSFKLSSQDIPELPLPLPLYEVWVYSPRFEAIHLRNTKVARGGIRWSDRREDFRTEILGLMKAQKVKNAIIVPSGAKGGFVLKATLHNATREQTQMEVISCYKAFICSLLDITDNIKDKKFIPPAQVVCHDEIDPYLVVAADKGTATFSDIANDISKAYHFWLGDAFASGGSTGYDHKKMGITARGAWESLKRHFRELNINVMKTSITVVGIGDMSGDVFGNGMLYSNQIKLVAAFDHRHIFIDPTPDPIISYNERKRLFDLPTSSWENYNSKLISKGGGVFKRTLKAIPLSPQIKSLLALEDNTLTPNDLVRALLKAPVDLLFNGGIGTYVKASTESQLDVGDRTNDYCRVDGNELRCKVVVEGGNLGFTQLGRVEYALKGGLINTDFIDNSAGVDCSDHEVNLKILLDHEVHKGKLSCKKRNEILFSMTQEVADLVLQDNYQQALVMSFTAHHANKNIGLHQSYIKELESQGVLKRKVEFLPDDRTILERKTAGIGLTRPELAVLLAYSKIHIKTEVLKSNLISDPYLSQIVETAFPDSMRKKYQHAMREHPLHTNIIATQLSNSVVNQMGFTYVYRIHVETGATIDEIICAFTASAHIFGTNEVQKLIEKLDFKLPMGEQYEMLYNIRQLLNLSTRWFLHNNYVKNDLQTTIEKYATPIKMLENVIPNLMAGHTQDYLQALVSKFLKIGLPEDLAKHIATYRAMYTSLNIVDVATKNKFDLLKTAQVYFKAGERINLVWFRDQIAADSREGHWNILARLTLRDELDFCQRAFTIAVMQKNHKKSDATSLIETWIENNPRVLQRWEKILQLIHSGTQIEYSMFFIAIRELLGLITTSQ